MGLESNVVLNEGQSAILDEEEGLRSGRGDESFVEFWHLGSLALLEPLQRLPGAMLHSRQKIAINLPFSEENAAAESLVCGVDPPVHSARALFGANRHRSSGRTEDMTKKIATLAALAAALLTVGCDEKPAAEEAKVEQPQVEAPPEKSAEEKAAEEKAAAEEAKKAEEEAKAQAELAKNPLTECCRALGQRGFTQRSPTYMAASKVCGEAMTGSKELAAVLPDIKKELGKEAVPDECLSK